jgi:hypothetical protein
MLRNKTLWLASGVAAGALITRWQFARWFSEEPDYEVEQREGSLEIRRYARSTRAETTVYARSWEEALDEGFKRLAGYIYGANHPRQLGALGGSVSDSQHPAGNAASGERIRMTTPVTARSDRLLVSSSVPPLPHVESGTDADLEPYTVTFTMPKSVAPRSLPVPDDSRIHLRAVPARRIAVLRYRGRFTFEEAADHARFLQEVLARAGLETRGEPEFAGYDAPSTLPWLRRNEIWVELAGAKSRVRLEPPTETAHRSPGRGAHSPAEAHGNSQGYRG